LAEKLCGLPILEYFKEETFADLGKKRKHRKNFFRKYLLPSK